MNTMQILQNVKTLRKKAGLTQMDMSDKMGLTQQNYGLLENGKTELTITKISKLAEIFGVSVGELLGLEGVQAVPNGEQASEIEALKKEVDRLGSQGRLMEKLLTNNEQYLQMIRYELESFFLEVTFRLSRNILWLKHSFLEDIFEVRANVSNDFFEVVYKVGLFGAKNENCVREIAHYYIEYYKKKVLDMDLSELNNTLRELMENTERLKYMKDMEGDGLQETDDFKERMYDFSFRYGEIAFAEAINSSKLKKEILKDAIQNLGNKEKRQNKQNT
jgi:transcriptional regulator with XRE-family HTH domain